MLAQGMGLDFRNLGGLYFPDGNLRRVRKIQIGYVEIEELGGGDRARTVAFPKQWLVRAEADAGALEYAGFRESPAARIARHMIYVDFRFEGVYWPPSGHGVPINGQWIRRVREHEGRNR
jgi:hypothetical protein